MPPIGAATSQGVAVGGVAVIVAVTVMPGFGVVGPVVVGPVVGLVVGELDFGGVAVSGVLLTAGVLLIGALGGPTDETEGPEVLGVGRALVREVGVGLGVVVGGPAETSPASCSESTTSAVSVVDVDVGAGPPALVATAELGVAAVVAGAAGVTVNSTVTLRRLPLERVSTTWALT